ncbi:MAG: insulinase family protein [Candidatus Sumerlaeaceae bacterium]|nr:insulinase family protein [Candidatus Sumerlaeaceae bacterium]
MIRKAEILAERIYQRLPNGLTVIARRVPNRVVTVDVWVGTGSANEDERLNGVTHFLEHMLFKGTPRFGPGELDRTIMEIGGVWNAGTSKDFTHYYVTVASPFFHRALDAVSDMIQHAVVDPVEFERERPVILEEIRRKQDSPGGVLVDTLYAVSFRKGPYKRSVLGTHESVSALSRDEMYAYYKSHYTADNMVVLVVGDMDPEAAVASIAESFGGLPPAPAGLSRLNNGLCERAAGESCVIKLAVGETYAALGFPAPAVDQADAVLALDLAATILADGRSSRLYRVLKEDLRLVSAVWAGSPTHRHESLFYVLMTLERAKWAEARRAALEVVRDLAARPPSEAEMAKARRIIRNGLFFSTETNTGQSATIGYYHTLTGSMEFYDTYLERLGHVTAEDVSRACAVFEAEPNEVIVEPLGGVEGSGA